MCTLSIYIYYNGTEMCLCVCVHVCVHLYLASKMDDNLLICTKHGGLNVSPHPVNPWLTVDLL